MSNIFVLHHTVCRWKVEGNWENSHRGWDEIQKLHDHIDRVLFSFCLTVFCWVAIYSIWSTLPVFHTDIHTDATPTNAQTPAYTHTNEVDSPFSACSQSPWRCLFTLRCDSCVCACVCVNLRKEILRVKCSPGLNYHFWVLSHHPTSQGLAVFLSVSLYNTHTNTHTHTHTCTHTGGALDSVSPVRRAVREERRRDWSNLTSWWVHTPSDWKISHAIFPFRHKVHNTCLTYSCPTQYKFNFQTTKVWTILM